MLPDDQTASPTDLDQLLAAEFAAKPYHLVDYAELQERSGLEAWEFSERFPDKASLWQYVLGLMQNAKKAVLASVAPPSTSLDTFAYLRWMFQIAVLFELRHPQLARVEERLFRELESLPTADPEAEAPALGADSFRDFLTQGILHDDIATWVDTEMSARLLASLYHPTARYLISRMGDQAKSLADGSVDIVYDPYTQDLFDTLMDILEAGMARDPQIRKDYYSKY